MAFEQYLTRRDVLNLLSVSDPTLRSFEKRDFPKPVVLGPQSRRWLRSEVSSWIEAHPRERVA